MYRIILSLSLVTALVLTGCGGKKEEKSNASNKSANLDQPSAMPAAEQAQIGFQVDIAKMMENPASMDMLDQQPGVPPFVKAMTGLVAFVSLPETFSPSPDGLNFYAKLDFKTDADAKAAMDELMKDAPAKPEEKGGTTYQVVREEGSPTVFFNQEGASLVAQSEAYAAAESKSFATDGLRAVMKGLPEAAFKMGFDMKSAQSFLSGAAAMAPAEEGMVKNIIDTVLKLDSMKVTGMGADYMMIGFNAPDEDTAKAVKQYLTQGVAALAGMSAMVAPDEKEAPATAEMFNHVLGSLSPKRDGNSTMIVIPKPDNFADLEKKMGEEMKKMAESGNSPFGGAGFPGAGGPGGGPPGGFPNK